MEYWKEAQLRETIAELEFHNRNQQRYLEQSHKAAKSLRNTDALDIMAKRHDERVAELEGIINDWKVSYSALLAQAQEYSERLNIRKIDFIREVNGKIFSSDRNYVKSTNSIILKRYIEQLVSDNTIYDIDFDDFFEWNDIRLYWTILAENGRPDAQYNLGWYYHDFSEEKSLEWFTRAAESGDERAPKEIDKIRIKQFQKESASVAKSVAVLIKEGSVQNALELIKDGISKGYDWAQSIAPYFSLVYSNKNLKSIFYNGRDAKGIKVKNFIQYCEIDLKNEFEQELIIKQPGSLRSGFLGEKVLPEFIKIPPKKSIRVEIWPQIPAEVSSTSTFVDPEWFFPKLEKEEWSFQIPSNLKLNDCYHRIDKSNCFVVSTCFNDHSHPTVLVFRRFRDDVLVHHGIGRAFIKQYYRLGPSVANWISDKPILKATCRKLFGLIAKIIV